MLCVTFRITEPDVHIHRMVEVVRKVPCTEVLDLRSLLYPIPGMEFSVPPLALVIQHAQFGLLSQC